MNGLRTLTMPESAPLKKIYRGQLVVMGNGPMGDEIRHMMDQEVEHLETFDRLLNERQVRPSLLDPVWGSQFYP